MARKRKKNSNAKANPIRDRIVDTRKVLPSELAKNPRNWRKHGKEQSDALEGILREVGIATPLVAYESPTHGLTLIDGHLRLETLSKAAPNEPIPVTILDVTDEEADKLLLTFDPLGAMATTDEAMLNELLQEVEFENEALEKMADEMAAEFEEEGEEEEDEEDDDHSEPQTLDTTFQILVTCRDESHQVELLERFELEGLQIRALLG